MDVEEEASDDGSESEERSGIEDPLQKMELEIARLEKELQYHMQKLKV